MQASLAKRGADIKPRPKNENTFGTEYRTQRGQHTVLPLPSDEEGDDDTQDYDADRDKTAATIVTLLRWLRRVMGTDIPGELHLPALALGRVLRLGFRLRFGLWLRIGFGRRPRLGAEPILLRLLVLGRDFVHDLKKLSQMTLNYFLGFLASISARSSRERFCARRMSPSDK